MQASAQGLSVSCCRRILGGKKRSMRYSAAQSEFDLESILSLQLSNLPSHISKTEAAEQGFVTVHHSLDILQAMNERYGHSLAWENNQLCGYALVMEKKFRDEIPVLFPMFELLDGIVWRGKPLAEWRYFVMGQICVAKAYRGTGVFAGLYHNLRARLSPSFDLVVTQISARNPRSVRAHEKTGFEVLHEYTAPDGEHWLVVGWPFMGC